MEDMFEYLDMLGSLQIAIWVIAFIATIAFMIFVFPRAKDGKLHPFLQTLHDIAHFKSLCAEVTLKFFYIFTNINIVLTVFFMLFISFKVGILFIILLPILLFIIRVFYEFILMSLILVQNVSNINEKMSKITNNNDSDFYAQEHKMPSYQPYMVFCTQCGVNYDANGTNSCPKCGHNK